jgi:hypothetical protein
MRSLLFWDVTQRIMVVRDVSGKIIGPIKNQSSWIKIFALLEYSAA